MVHKDHIFGLGGEVSILRVSAYRWHDSQSGSIQCRFSKYGMNEKLRNFI